MQDPKKRNQKGFTLIEIIAVLVILGILAAVAIPKYQDLKAQSANQAIQGALGAGASQAAMSYAKATLSANTVTGTGTEAVTQTPILRAVSDLNTNYQTLGDFTVSYSSVTIGTGSTANGIKVTVTGYATGSAQGKTIWDTKTISGDDLTKTVAFE